MDKTEWMELESDPGLFTLLLEDFGVKGVQVEEVYDLSKPITEVVYGFIFLFRWDNSKKKPSRRSGKGSLNSSTSLVTSNTVSSTINDVTTSVSQSSTSDSARSLNTSNQKESIRSRPRSGGTMDGECLSTEDGIHQANCSASDSLYIIPNESVDIFFAQQIVQNSCATHALLSILFNRPELDLGCMLTEFRKATCHLSPEAKGLAIGSMPQLAKAHNKHAYKPFPLNDSPSKDNSIEETSVIMPETGEAVAAAVSAALAVNNPIASSVTNTIDSSAGTMCSSNSTSVQVLDTFHFVCYVPIGGFLYELDGLKPNPINHGILLDPESRNGWTKQCVEILKTRMQEQDLRHCLMAVVPDRRLAVMKRIDTLHKNRQIIEDTLHRLSQLNEVRKSMLHGDTSRLFEGNLSGQVFPDLVGSTRRESSLTSLFSPTKPEILVDYLKPWNEPSDAQNTLILTKETVELPNSSQQNDLVQDIPTRTIRTRSITRTSGSREDKSLNNSTEFINDRLDSPKSVSLPTSKPEMASELNEDHSVTELPEYHTRKRSFPNNANDSESSSSLVGCGKRKRFSDLDVPAPKKPSTPPQHPSPSNCQMGTLLLASISSADSPQLMTLTETVTAAKRAVDDALEDSGYGQLSMLPFKKSDESIHSSSWNESDVPVSSISHLPRSNGTASKDSIRCKLETVDSSSACSQNNTLSFPYLFGTCLPPGDLTKPLTVDTQLWHQSPSDHLTHIHELSNLNSGMDSSNKPEGGASHELRPQTRALTRARIKVCPPSDSAAESAEVISRVTASAKETQHVADRTSSTLSVPRSSEEYLQPNLRKNNLSDTSDATASLRSSTTKYSTRFAVKRGAIAQSIPVSHVTVNKTNCPPTPIKVAVSTASETVAGRLCPSESIPYQSSNSTTNSVMTDCYPKRYPHFTVNELRVLLHGVEEHIKACDEALSEEKEKRRTYRLDDARRTHNYEPFIRTYLLELTKHGMLRDLVVAALGTNNNTSSPTSSGQSSTERFAKSKTVRTSANGVSKHKALKPSSRSKGRNPHSGSSTSNRFTHVYLLSTHRLRARTKSIPSNNSSLTKIDDESTAEKLIETSQPIVLGNGSIATNTVHVSAPNLNASDETTIEVLPEETPPTSTPLNRRSDLIVEQTKTESDVNGVSFPAVFTSESEVVQTSYSSGSASLSPQSSSSSRSTIVHLRASTGGSKIRPLEDAAISAKSLRPRTQSQRHQSQTDHPNTRSIEPDATAIHHPVLRRNSVLSTEVNDASNGTPSNDVVVTFNHRFRKRRVC